MEFITDNNPKWGTALFLAAGFVYLYLTVFLLPATPIFFENDHFIQMYDSVRMLNGETLYRDFFQFTFPGTEVWYLVLFKIFGERIWLLNATIVLLGLSIAATMLAISRRLMSGPYVYIPPIIFLFFGFRWYGMDGGHRLFSVLFATLGVLVLIEKTSSVRLVAAGSLCAFAAFFTQNRGVGITAAIAVFIVWDHYSSKRYTKLPELFRSLAVFGGAFAATLLILLGYFLFTAGVGAFIESTLLFAKNYNADPLNNSNLYLEFWQNLFRGSVSLSSLPVDLFYFLLVPAVYVIPLAYYSVKRTSEIELRRKVVLLSLGGICLFLVTTGLNSVRLYHVAIPGIILLTLWGYRSSKRVIALAAAGCIVSASTGLCVWGQVRPYTSFVDLPTGTVVFMSEAAGERYRWVNDHTESGDVVFEPYRSVINFPLLVRNPTSFSFLRNSDYTPPGHVETVVRQLNVTPPKYILWDGSWSADVDSGAGHLRPLRDHLKQNYRLREKLTPVYEFEVEVWERNER
jgi:hypothetical protein